MQKIFQIILLCNFLSTGHAQTIYYATQFATGIQDGSSWSNATYLNLALDAAQQGDQVWVKWGTYRASGFNRDVSFKLKKGIKVYGGFMGIETSLNQRDLTSPLQSFITGDIGTSQDFSDNSYHVFTATDCDSTTVMDGFVIALGNANGSESNQNRGGGLLIDINDPNILYGPVIRNCTFLQCQAAYGGGLAVISSTGFTPSLIMHSTLFESNVSQFGGGGMYFQGDFPQGCVSEIRNCNFSFNRAKFGLGGGIDFESVSGKFRFEGCRFFRDSTRNGSEGGGVSMGLSNFDCDVSFKDCKFEECYGAVAGGLYVRDDGVSPKFCKILLSNTIFQRNKSQNEGGGIGLFGGLNTVADVSLDSVVFDGNLANSDAAGININYSGSCVLNLKIQNSYFKNNNGGTPGAGAIRIFHYTGVNTKSKVLINNCLFNNNTGALSIVIPPPPYKASCYTHILNSTFVNNSKYVFNKTWSPDFDYVDSYNFMDIYNCVIVDSTELKRVFYNNSFNPFTMNDYRVNHCLLSKPDCIFEGQSVCGDQMLYDIDPEFEDNSFFPKPCSPLVNAGNNFWPDSFNISTDILGANRIDFDTVDIGAYEVTQPCISDASFQPKSERYPLFKLLKNPVAEYEPLILLSDQLVFGEINVQVFDLTGTRLINKTYSAGTQQMLKVSPSLRAGIYVAVVSTETKKYALRFVVAG